jgi:very-short-patch-repair endonuclease
MKTNQTSSSNTEKAVEGSFENQKKECIFDIKRNSKNYFSLPFNPKLIPLAKKLRKSGNLSEVLMWNIFKNKNFKHLDFDRQKIIGNYIVDFYCPNLPIVIEIDGNSHNDKEEYDETIDLYLNNLGLRVIHIEDIAVLNDINKVITFLNDYPYFKESNS